MRRLNTAKTLRFALAALLLAVGTGLVGAAALNGLEEDSSDGASPGSHIEGSQEAEAERGVIAVGHREHLVLYPGGGA